MKTTAQQNKNLHNYKSKHNTGRINKFWKYFFIFANILIFFLFILVVVVNLVKNIG